MPPIQIKLDSKQLQLTVEGVNKLGSAAKQAVMDEIGATAVDMLGKSVEKLKNNGSVATSNLANSGRVKKMKNYWTVGYTASYAWVISEAGDMPERLILTSHNPTTVLAGSKRYFAVGTTGFEEVAIAVKNPYALAGFTRS